jgi:hypothetical protein
MKKSKRVRITQSWKVFRPTKAEQAGENRAKAQYIGRFSEESLKFSYLAAGFLAACIITT